MKVLISGALGHIGSYLIRELPKTYNFKKIYIVDNFESLRFPSLFNLPNYNYKFINKDLSIEDFKEDKVDLVLHFAAKTDAVNSFNNLKEFKKNKRITSRLIKYCNLNNAKFVFASTTSVYGTQNKIVDENCSLKDLKPQSPYASVKLEEEKLIKKMMKTNNYIILRLGTIYGYSIGMRFHTAVNKFCFQASSNIPITIWKTALNQKRPYLSIYDLNRSIGFIMKNNLFDGEIYNILTNNHTVSYIVNIISSFKKINKIFVNSPIMNQLSYEVSSKKFTSKGFKFKGSLKREVKKTMKMLNKIS
ncbi:MAG: SDR family oxidoreductase [Alphaproteobacteria bacterium]|nr:SDR family oxidoreductase [Alphaproteobacteria bacterium]